MRGLRILGALAVIGAAAGFAAQGSWPWRRLHVAAPIVVSTAFREVVDTLRSGETLSDLFARQRVHGISLAELKERFSLDPRRLRSGLVFRFRRELTDSSPSSFVVRTGPEQRLRFHRASEGWNAESEAIRWSPEVMRFEGEINNSVYEALDQQIADDVLDGEQRTRLAWDLADVFAWQIDFSRDIQSGDRFQVLVERLVSEEGEVRFGRILASDLSVGGKRYTAFRFQDSAGRSSFYNAEGLSLRRAFLRAPVAFRRISSTFSRSRFHPVLGITRRHAGTDYSAAPGTPVMAAGDGVVVRAGRAGGYGNLVEIRHRNGITTRYAHLRGFARGIRSGVRVEQGQTIGYVGSTGVSTGPHLHYEFRVNGVPKDSRRVDLGGGQPIPPSQLAAFRQERQRYEELLYQSAGPVLAQRSE